MSVEKMCISAPIVPILENFTFTPQSAPYDALTELKINHRKLFGDFSILRVDIKVAGMKCELFGIDSTIECRVRGINAQTRKGRIRFEKFQTAVISTNDFQFVDPSIDDFYPKFGPRSGGTNVTIIGKYLNAGDSDKIKVYIGGVSCDILSLDEKKVIFKSSPWAYRRPSQLRMEFGAVRREFDYRQGFRYDDDPTIELVTSNRTNKKILRGIPAGVSKIFVKGFNFKIMQKIQMYVYYENKTFESNCSAKTNIGMECDSPIIISANSKELNADVPMKLEYGFIMDDVIGVRNLSTKGHPKFELYPNPFFDKFSEFVKYKDGNSLVITGKDLDLVCKESDMHVFIGSESCNITKLSRSSLECKLPTFVGNNE